MPTRAPHRTAEHSEAPQAQESKHTSTDAASMDLHRMKVGTLTVRVPTAPHRTAPLLSGLTQPAPASSPQPSLPRLDLATMTSPWAGSDALLLALMRMTVELKRALGCKARGFCQVRVADLPKLPSHDAKTSQQGIEEEQGISSGIPVGKGSMSSNADANAAASVTWRTHCTAKTVLNLVFACAFSWPSYSHLYRLVLDDERTPSVGRMSRVYS